MADHVLDHFEVLSSWRDAASLTPIERAWCTDATLRRYCSARPHSASAALAMLQATLLWRRSAIENPLHCPLCDQDKSSHCFVPIGKVDASVLIYSCPARAAHSDVEGTVRHVVHSLEHAFECHGCATWTWIVDFKGFGLTHALQARLSIAFARVFADHFPERLQHLILINAPTVFGILLSAAQPFADARTLSKIVRINGTPAEVAATFAARGIPPELCAWMSHTLSLNAKPGVLPPLPLGAGALMPRSPGAPDSWLEQQAEPFSPSSISSPAPESPISPVGSMHEDSDSGRVMGTE